MVERQYAMLTLEFPEFPTLGGKGAEFQTKRKRRASDTYVYRKTSQQHCPTHHNKRFIRTRSRSGYIVSPWIPNGPPTPRDESPDTEKYLGGNGLGDREGEYTV